MTNDENLRLTQKLMQEMLNPSRFTVTTTDGRKFSGFIDASRFNGATWLGLLEGQSTKRQSFRLKDVVSLERQSP